MLLLISVQLGLRSSGVVPACLPGHIDRIGGMLVDASARRGLIKQLFWTDWPGSSMETFDKVKNGFTHPSSHPHYHLQSQQLWQWIGKNVLRSMFVITATGHIGHSLRQDWDSGFPAGRQKERKETAYWASETTYHNKHNIQDPSSVWTTYEDHFPEEMGSVRCACGWTKAQNVDILNF